MNDDKHISLINDLSSKLTPVNVNWSAEKRSVFWIFTHFIWILALMILIGPFRETLIADFHETRFVIEMVLFLCSITLTIYFSFLSLVPGGISKNKFKFLALPIIFLLAFLVQGYLNSESHGRGHGLRTFCELEILLYSIGPICHFYYLAKKGIFIDRLRPFVFAVCASTLIPASIMHMACAYDYLHILLFHLSPVFLVTLLMYLLIKKTNKKTL